MNRKLKSREQKKVFQLNIFLLKTEIKSWNEAVDEKAGAEKKLASELGWTGGVYYRQTPLKNPDWKTDFLDKVAEEKLELKGNASTAALLFMEVNHRIFVLTFGSGRYLLKREYVEPDFGVRVVINRVRSESIKALSIKQFEQQLMKKTEEATRETEIDDFDVDKRRDVVSGLTGTPEDSAFAKKISGADGLILRKKMNPKKDLPKVLKEILRAYKEEPPEIFKWVLRIRPISDASLIEEYQNKLLASIRKKTDSVVFDLPDHISEEECKSFGYGGGEPKEDLCIDHWLKTCPSPNIVEIKDRSISILMENGETVQLRPIDLCSWDTDNKKTKEVVVLASGHWYRIRKDFVEDVEAFLDSARKQTINITFPKAASEKGKTAEENYLDLLVEKNSQNVVKYHGGSKVHSQGDEVEACDVFINRCYFGHAKIWKGSQSFSALMKQGENAAEIMLKDEKYREGLSIALKKLCGSSIDGIPRDFAPSRFGVCFILIRRATREIPFFSKLSFYRSGEGIKSLGYRLAFREVKLRS